MRGAGCAVRGMWCVVCGMWCVVWGQDIIEFWVLNFELISNIEILIIEGILSFLAPGFKTNFLPGFFFFTNQLF